MMNTVEIINVILGMTKAEICTFEDITIETTQEKAESINM